MGDFCTFPVIRKTGLFNWFCALFLPFGIGFFGAAIGGLTRRRCELLLIYWPLRVFRDIDPLS